MLMFNTPQIRYAYASYGMHAAVFLSIKDKARSRKRSGWESLLHFISCLVCYLALLHHIQIIA